MTANDQVRQPLQRYLMCDPRPTTSSIIRFGICCLVLAAVDVAVFGAETTTNPPATAPAATAEPSPPAPSELPATPKAALVNTMDALDDKHQLAAGDRLSFRIIEDQEDPKPMIVTDLGDVEVPYLGRFPAENKTCKQLAQELKVELEKKYYYQATVIVAVDVLSRSRGKVYVVGHVRGPGALDIPSDEVFTVSKAVLRAGGFLERADTKKVKITRQGGDKKTDQTFVVNVGEIIEKGRTANDILLQPGDVIFVPGRILNL